LRARRRIERLRGRHALVDGIPFELPVDSRDSPALMAAFPISASAAAELIPGEEVRPLRLGADTGVLVVTVINYITTDIGSYVEFSLAIACLHGLTPGQWVVDLPVSTEVSVKGGKGVWGMPKHQANLNFVERADKVWSQYDLDGRLCCRIEVDRPRLAGLPLRASAANFCAFRGMLFKSRISFKGRAGVNVPFTRTARLTFGEHPRMAPLKALRVGERPLLSAYLEDTQGILDDHTESWFLTYEEPPTATPEGLDSVAGLGLGQEWLEPPDEFRASR
jgi:hypothetical protein